ncbi:MAG: N-acetyltransferase [Deltaproteobacteria bacterium]|nr:N-acetyltransferase [Deltaproteobacteria bacterium]MBI3386929.1 N-acetyltransferase [Deltaproteobacteria bacterium]
MSLAIRAETIADYAAIHEINALAFGRDDEARLVEAIRASAEFIPELSLVAVDGTTVVGHVLFSRIALQTSEGALPALALAPMAVRPKFQNRGVGCELVRHGLDDCRRLGHRIVVVVGHPNYYPRFGFTSARALGLEAPYRDAAFMALELMPGVLRGVRGTVEYPAAFSQV